MSPAYYNINNFKVFIQVPLNPFCHFNLLIINLHGKYKGDKLSSFRVPREKPYFLFKFYTRLNMLV